MKRIALIVRNNISLAYPKVSRIFDGNMSILWDILWDILRDILWDTDVWEDWGT